MAARTAALTGSADARAVYICDRERSSSAADALAARALTAPGIKSGDDSRPSDPGGSKGGSSWLKWPNITRLRRAP